MRRSAALAPLAALAVLAGACGGDGGSDTLSREEFIRRAEAICAEADQRTEQRDQAFDDATTEAEVQELIDAQLADARRTIEELRDLEPPEALAADVQRLLTELETTTAELEGLTVEELSQIEDDPFAEANRLAAEIGLSECADDQASDGGDGGEGGEGAGGDAGAAGDIELGGAAAEAFVEVEGWSYADAPADVTDEFLAEFAGQREAAQVIDSVATTLLSPDDGGDGALVISFAFTGLGDALGGTFQEGVLQGITEDGGTTSDITVAGEEAVRFETADAVGIYWQGEGGALMFFGPTAEATEAAATALLSARNG